MIAVARSSEIAPGAMLPVVASGIPMVIFRAADGSVTALFDRCSHADVKLSEGDFDGCRTVECLAHGAKFDVTDGRALCLPAVKGVTRYRCEERDGIVLVEVP